MVDGLSSQNFHFSLDTTTIHVNVADTPVADTAEATEPAVMDASEGTADAATDTAPSELATPPASYWSLAHVVADTLAATANVNDAEAPAVADPHAADPHAEQPAAASVSVDDGQLADGAVSSPYHAAQEVLAPESVESEATSPDTAAPEAAAPSLFNLALHHYGAVDTLAASDSAASV